MPARCAGVVRYAEDGGNNGTVGVLVAWAGALNT